MLGPNEDWQNSGGSVVWNGGYWSLVFNTGGPDLPYTTTTAGMFYAHVFYRYINMIIAVGEVASR